MLREPDATSRVLVHLVATYLAPFASAAVASLQVKYLAVRFEIADTHIIASGGGFVEQALTNDIDDALYREKLLSDGAPLRKIMFDWLF
jgi:hypothetical protein